ncbi:MAG: hypothetical protein NZ651_00265 [Candidatus Bipolaricaulota bacterium]|nr:hypothetical protein [Candidatus Bipolaricaulota bacterium]MDW8126204.1 hypothetical protein [Candidatus Bipolaricaulota bacterium]
MGWGDFMLIFGLLGMLGVMAFGQTSLVLYSTGTALVEETRTVTLAKEGVLELWGFPRGTLWETLVVEGVEILALRPVPPKAWSLQDLLGKEITVQTKAGAFRGVLREISEEGLVVETEEGVVLVREYLWLLGPTYTPTGQSQVILCYRCAEPGEKNVRFRYLAQGLTWEISYDAEFAGGNLTILGKALVQNDTGMDFRNAKITLIAGAVRGPAKDTGLRALAFAPEAASTEAGEAFEYHRYDLFGTWDLPQGRMVLPLVHATIPATEFYRFSGGPVEVGLRFNTKETVFPAGEIRVYAEGIFVGANNIGHLPKGKDAELVVGAAFDLTGTRVQVRRERIGENLYRDTWCITLRSAKDKKVEVEVIETLSGYWRILSASFPYEIVDAQRVKFVVPILPGSETALEYVVEWRY